MSFPVIIIFLVLCLWVVICTPLLASSYLDGDLVDDYDTVILLSLLTSLLIVFIIVTILHLVIIAFACKV